MTPRHLDPDSIPETPPSAGRHVAPERPATPRLITPAFAGPAPDVKEGVMSTDDGRVTIPVTERYRAAILASGGLSVAVLMSLSDTFVPGRPLGGIEVINVVLGAVVMAAVYWPASPWVKLASGMAGTLVQWLASAMTDDRITAAEWTTVAATLITAVMLGAFPNAPKLVVGEPGDDEPDVPGGTTYLPPSQRKDGVL